MKKIWSKYKLIIIIAVSLAFLALAVNYITLPLIKKIEKASYDLEAKRIDREMEKKRLDTLPGLEADWLEYESKKTALDVILSKEGELDFIKGVEAIAEKTGNEITFKVAKDSNPNEFIRGNASKKEDKDKKTGIIDQLTYQNYFPIQMTLKGDYHGLINFIHLLENSRFYVNVTQLDIKKEEAEEETEEKALFGSPGEEKNNAEQAKKIEVITSNINAIVYIKK